MYSQSRIDPPAIRVSVRWPSDFRSIGCSASILLFIVGMAGILMDARSGAVRGTWLNLHSLFGLLLACGVLGSLALVTVRSPELSRAHLDRHVRDVSRVVYALLYLLTGVEQVAEGRLPFSSTRPELPFAAPENLQVYLLYGVLAIAALRIAAARIAPRPAASRT